MLRVSPQGDAIHPPSCSLAIREAVEEIKWQRAEMQRAKADADIDRLIRKRMAEAWEEGWFDRDCREADWDNNPYRGRRKE